MMISYPALTFIITLTATLNAKYSKKKYLENSEWSPSQQLGNIRVRDTSCPLSFSSFISFIHILDYLK